MATSETKRDRWGYRRAGFRPEGRGTGLQEGEEAVGVLDRCICKVPKTGTYEAMGDEMERNRIR
jgi:hypothetical protein